MDVVGLIKDTSLLGAACGIPGFSSLINGARLQASDMVHNLVSLRAFPRSTSRGGGGAVENCDGIIYYIFPNSRISLSRFETVRHLPHKKNPMPPKHVDHRIKHGIHDLSKR